VKPRKTPRDHPSSVPSTTSTRGLLIADAPGVAASKTDRNLSGNARRLGWTLPASGASIEVCSPTRTLLCAPTQRQWPVWPQALSIDAFSGTPRSRFESRCTEKPFSAGLEATLSGRLELKKRPGVLGSSAIALATPHGRTKPERIRSAGKPRQGPRHTDLEDRRHRTPNTETVHDASSVGARESFLSCPDHGAYRDTVSSDVTTRP
jgi:hypothetical protein